MKKQGIRGLAAGILLALSVAMTAAAGPADEIIAVEAQGQQVPQAEGVQQVQAPGSPVVDVAGPGAAGAQNPEQQADAAAMAAWQQAQAEALAAQQAAQQQQSSGGGGSYTPPSTTPVVSGSGQFTNPCPGAVISSTFGYRDFDGAFHKGLDLAAGEGTPTYAAADGTVVIAGWSDSAGNWVVINHGNGLTTKYMHHSALCVTAGQTVVKGQQIGYVGNTGNSFGAHLHFQVESGGVAVDPLGYL